MDVDVSDARGRQPRRGGVAPSVDPPRVAVLGMGRMGGAMAKRLREKGFPVAVYNRDGRRSREIADEIGAVVLDRPSDAGPWVAPGDDRAEGDTGSRGVVLVSLADDAACRAVYLGADGLVSALPRDAIVCDTSTIDPDTVRNLADAVDARHAALLDTPVSGSVSLALVGGLTVMAGGDEAALQRATQVLDGIAQKIYWVGASGAGAVAKLGVNAVVHALNQAIAESLVLAEKAGVSRSVFYEVLANSAAAAPFVGYKRAAFEDPDRAPVAFSLDLVAKDLQLILDLADRVGAAMPEARAVRSAAQDAIGMGLGDGDMSVVAQYLRRK